MCIRDSPKGEFRFINRENSTFSFSVDWIGDAVTWDNWNIFEPGDTLPYYSSAVSIVVDETPLAVWAAWFTVESERITLHFSARSTEVSE